MTLAELKANTNLLPSIYSMANRAIIDHGDNALCMIVSSNMPMKSYKHTGFALYDNYPTGISWVGYHILIVEVTT